MSRFQFRILSWTFNSDLNTHTWKQSIKTDFDKILLWLFYVIRSCTLNFFFFEKIKFGLLSIFSVFNFSFMFLMVIFHFQLSSYIIPNLSSYLRSPSYLQEDHYLKISKKCIIIFIWSCFCFWWRSFSRYLMKTSWHHFLFFFSFCQRDITSCM